jgi:hypothetical protein
MIASAFLMNSTCKSPSILAAPSLVFKNSFGVLVNSGSLSFFFFVMAG